MREGRFPRRGIHTAHMQTPQNPVNYRGIQYQDTRLWDVTYQEQVQRYMEDGLPPVFAQEVVDLEEDLDQYGQLQHANPDRLNRLYEQFENEKVFGDAVADNPDLADEYANNPALGADDLVHELATQAYIDEVFALDAMTRYVVSATEQ